jgi:hypothetical protein
MPRLLVRYSDLVRVVAFLLSNRITRSHAIEGATRLKINISQPHELQQFINLHDGVHMTVIEDCRATPFMRLLFNLSQ